MNGYADIPCSHCSRPSHFFCQECKVVPFCGSTCAQQSSHLPACEPPDSTDRIDELEDRIVAQQNSRLQWEDVMLEIVNDGTFRQHFLLEIAGDNSDYTVLPTFTLAETHKVWLIEIENYGLLYDGPEFGKSGVTQLAWFLRQFPLAGRRFVMLSVRERIRLDNNELSVHYNNLVLDLKDALAYYFEPGSSLWGPLTMVKAMRAALARPEVKSYFQKRFDFRSAVPRCRIQLPRSAERVGLTPDNFCQSWTLLILYHFIRAGGAWAAISEALSGLENTKTQQELTDYLFDKFFNPCLRPSDAYYEALTSGGFDWNNVVSAY